MSNYIIPYIIVLKMSISKIASTRDRQARLLEYPSDRMTKSLLY